MKKYILLILLCCTTIMSYSQYTVKSKQIMYKLEVKDSLFFSKLDSIVFAKYPCNSSARHQREQYLYFVSIKEKESKNYRINVVYAKPSNVESDLNTGIYTYNDKSLIVREESEQPLFLITNEKIHFIYEKQLMKKAEDSYDLEEIIAPEEFCTWVFTYSNGAVEISHIGF